MARIIVGVLRGGASEQYAHSLKSGAAAIAALPDDHYDVRDIFIDKDGVWHSRGVPSHAERILSHLDVVLNMLHGEAGENGLVQRVLERSGVRYAGARPESAALSLNKARAREALRAAGVRVAQGHAFTTGMGGTTADMAMKVFQSFAPPYIVKPVKGGASIGIQFAPAIGDLPDAIGDVLDEYGAAVVEEYVRGHEATVGVLQGFRGEDLYAFPPVHVMAPEGARFVDATAHAEGRARHVVPSHFSHEEKQQLANAARAAHAALDMGHYSRVDMILTPRGPVVLEVNANPALHDKAPFPKMLESVGSSLKEFLEHAIALAQRKSGKNF